MTARRVYQMIEIRQNRCDLRFGIGACGATGTPKCYQTYETCLFKSAFNLDGIIRWRFIPKDQTTRGLYEANSSDDISTHGIPCILSINTRPSRINLGASRKGESPFGLRSELRVEFDDFAWDDRDGDFYTADRTVVTSSFWGKFVRRTGDAVQQLEAYHYQWYEGETLAQATVSRFDVQNIVHSGKRASLTAQDPLQRTEARKAQFPRATDAILRQDINSTQTTGIQIIISATEIAANYGNTGSQRYLAIGSEIIRYTGYVDNTDYYTLTGVQRGALGTTADEFEAEEKVQRVGRYSDMRLYEIAQDLIENHSTFDASLIPSAQWDDEGDRYLATLRSTATIAEPEDVQELLGELTRDGLFYIWWDEREQEVPLRAVRPPEGTPSTYSQATHLVNLETTRKPDDRLTRVVVYYNKRDPTEDDSPENFRNLFIRVDAEAEGAFYADGTVREEKIFSRWINTEANARLVGAALTRRYKSAPEYVRLTLDAKDRAINIGDVLDLSTPDIIDFEGNTETRRWDVIEYEEVDAGFQVEVLLQRSPYSGRFATIMANTAPLFAAATDEEKANGCWMADEVDNLMPDDSDPYQLR